MGTRYLVTGVQLGMLRAHTDLNRTEEAKILVGEIISKQFVGTSDQTIEVDAERVGDIFFREEN